MNVGAKIREAYDRIDDPSALAIADTWFLLQLATRGLYGMLAARWLNLKGIRIRMISPVITEYENFWRAEPTIPESEKVPWVPRSLGQIIEETSTSFPTRQFSEPDAPVVSNLNLSPTDKRLALEARIVAQRFGKSYLITNDTELIGKSGQRFGRLVEEQGLDVTIIAPSYIRQHFAWLLPELGLQLLVPDSVLADLYVAGKNGESGSGVTCVRVQRRQQFAFGGFKIETERAIGVFKLGSQRKAPYKTDSYGIPAVTTKDLGQQQVEDAMHRLKPVMPQRLAKFKFALLPESEKYFPTFLSITTQKGKLFYEKIMWARI